MGLLGVMGEFAFGFVFSRGESRVRERNRWDWFAASLVGVNLTCPSAALRS